MWIGHCIQKSPNRLYGNLTLHLRLRELLNGGERRLITQEQDLEWVDSSRLEDSMLSWHSLSPARQAFAHSSSRLHPSETVWEEEGGRKRKEGWDAEGSQEGCSILPQRLWDTKYPPSLHTLKQPLLSECQVSLNAWLHCSCNAQGDKFTLQERLVYGMVKDL